MADMHQNCDLTDKEQAGPQHRIHNRRERGHSMLGIWTQTRRHLPQGLGLASGWEGLGRDWEEGKEKGRWDKPSHPNDQAPGFPWMELHLDHV